MKRRWLILPIFILIPIFILLPLGFLSAKPSNLVLNGNFEDSGGSFDGWTVWAGNWMIENHMGNNYAKLIQDYYPGGIDQYIYGVNDLNLNFGYDIWIKEYSPNSNINVILSFFMGSTEVFYFIDDYNGVLEGSPNPFVHIGYNALERWQASNSGPYPAFDNIYLNIYIDVPGYGGVTNIRFDNFTLSHPSVAPTYELIWIRDREMTCQYVWINEDGNFQFSFIYPYADNNWVRIFDMQGNMVYAIDMPYDNPNIIVDLPDGTYKVQTFHDQVAPIQEFMIGKP